jgi:serine/threonine protein kinase
MAANYDNPFTKTIPSFDRIIDFTEFTVIGEIGRGGSVVTVMRNSRGDRFAVKFFRMGPDFDERRIKQEVDILCAMNHPYILGIKGWGLPKKEFSGVRIATKFMPLGSLEDALLKEKEGNSPSFWSHEFVSKMLVGIVMGFRYLSEVGVIHGNLKPSNLFCDEKYCVRIGDFGHSRLISAEFTWSGNVNCCNYIAPEVVFDRMSPTEKSDVFAFGVILYEVLTHNQVFRGSEIDVVRMLRDNVRPPIPPYIHPTVSALIERCWSKNPEERPRFEEIYDVLSDEWFPFYRDVSGILIREFCSELQRNEALRHIMRI